MSRRSCLSVVRRWQRSTTPSATEDLGVRITLLGAGVNMTLGLAKLVAGYACGSAALVSDGAHSLSDLLTDGIALVTYRASREPPDARHPFGHGKIEAAGACGVGGALFVAGGGAGLHAGTALWESWTAVAPAPPEFWAPAAAVAVVSIAAKEYLYRATKAVGESEKSSVVVANAYHHRSDAFSSVASLAGVMGSVFVHPILDPIFGMTVAFLVLDSGFRVARAAIDELLDASVEDPALLERLRLVRVEGARIARLRARKSGPNLIVDAALRLKSGLTASEAHQLGEHAKLAILHEATEAGYRLNDVLLHFDPEDRQELPPDDPCRDTLLPTPDRVQRRLRRTLACTLARTCPAARLDHVAVRYTRDSRFSAVLTLAFPSRLSLRDAARLASRLKAKLMRAHPKLLDLDVLADLSARCRRPRRRR